MPTIGDTVVYGHTVSAGFVVVIVMSFAPVGRRFSAKQWRECKALHVAGLFGTSDIEEGLGEVEIGNEIGIGGVGLDLAGPANDERCVQAFFVHPALVEPAVFAEPEALVGAVDNHGVIGEPVVVEILQQSADIFIHCLYATEVIFDVALVIPARASLTLQVEFLERLIAWTEMAVENLELFRGEFTGVLEH